jgi:LCP family protein required for cell wall assembly
VGRTDAILIVAFNYAHSKIGVISIPRDLWVEVPGLDPGRINTVYRIGERELGKGKGLAALKGVIHREIGIRVNHTVIADFQGFVSIIDHLEGIPVNVVCPIEDCFITDQQDAGCDPLSLKAGKHQLDGATALKFARSRHGRTDIDRARRQQSVLAGLKERLTRPTIIPKLPGLWSRIRDHVSTDIDVRAALKMGALLARIDENALHGLVLKQPVVDDARTPDGKRVLVLDRKKAWARAKKLFEQPRPGKRRHATCPAPDVGLHWRERVKKYKSESKKRPPKKIDEEVLGVQ